MARVSDIRPGAPNLKSVTEWRGMSGLGLGPATVPERNR